MVAPRGMGRMVCSGLRRPNDTDFTPVGSGLQSCEGFLPRTKVCGPPDKGTFDD